MPDRLSYSELFANNIFLRHDDVDVISFVEKLSNSDTFYIASEQAKVHARDFAKPYCESAISKILEVIVMFTNVIITTQFEAIHAWYDCPYDDVSYYDILTGIYFMLL